MTDPLMLAAEMHVTRGEVSYLLIPREILNRALAALKGWEYDE